jgi:asparagine synthase (glutamine-hydrolysing)
MCGFVSWFQSRGFIDQPLRKRLTTALKLITHRGPDDGLEASGGDWWMGFRRLAILDLSTAGRQPMRFSNGRHTLTFNGEIYNYQSLRKHITDKVFQSTGDTEVLGSMLQRWPVEEVLAELRGMFSFAWHDAVTREVVAARDHFGIKPLYYATKSDGTLILSSEIKVIRYLLDTDAKVNRRALAQFFRWGSVQAPDTILEGVHCLPPGHLLRWKEGKLEIKRWFTPAWPAKAAWLSSRKDQLEAVRQGITGSVQAHLISDVPVGVFLSGGLDSTLIAALMRREGMERVKAFSLGYEQGSGVPDESDVARRTAEFLGCDFHHVRMNAASLVQKLDGYLDSLDQPTGDALNTWLVSQLAAEHVKVTLSGLGADEWFGGYNYHRLVHLAHAMGVASSGLSKVTSPVLKSLTALIPQSVQGASAWKALYYSGGAAGRDALEMHAHARSIFSNGGVSKLMGCSPEEVSKMCADSDVVASLKAERGQRAPDSWLHELLLLETETYLANTLLRDNDATSMSHSLELRVPFVDREVFDLAGKLPPSSKLSLSGGKTIIRESFRDILPEWIYNDRQKNTFTLPLMKWMREEPFKQRVIDTLQSRKCQERGWMDPHEINACIRRFYASSSADKRGWKISQTVWLMFVLESWAQRVLDVPEF